MKFQNISIHGSKVILCRRKRDERKNERSNAQTRSYMPPPFQSWEHKSFVHTGTACMHCVVFLLIFLSSCLYSLVMSAELYIKADMFAI